MNEIRLRWEPKSLVSERDLVKCLLNYTNSKGGISLLRNGTVLFIKSSGNDIEDAKKSMDEARFLTDFEIQPMDDGNYLVIFHSAVSVFVSLNEFDSRKKEILKRMDELKFRSEEFVFDKDNNGDGILLGLYARGKLQKDAYEFEFLKRI